MFVTDRDEMSNLNRGHSIDDSYQVSVVAMFVNDRDEMSNLYPIVNKHGYHRNLVGSIYGMSSMKIAHFIPIG
jgi:hypothetical protein